MNISGITQIKASAGSGKTYTLTRIFLTLLAYSSAGRNTNTFYMWHEILAMTFTNKSVAEMKHAVLSLLKNIAIEKDTSIDTISSTEASLWIDTILQQYDFLRIQSIDSILLKIIRLSSLSLGLPPHCVPLIGTEEQKALDTVYNEFLLEAESNTHYQTLLHKAWRTLVAENPSGIRMNDSTKKIILELVQLMLVHGYFIPSDTAEEAYTGYTYYIELLQERYGKNKTKQKLEKLLHTMQTYIEQYNVTNLHSNFIKALKKPFITKEGISKLLYKESFSSVCTQKTVISQQAEFELSKLYTEISSTATLITYIGSSVSDAVQYAPLVGIAQRIIVLLQEYQKKHASFLFSTAPRLVEEIFSSPEAISEALFYLGTHLKHILIDEFQDTSTAQWNALQPLIDTAVSSGGSFTYVGDVKQAIYGWRGGNSNLFEDILEDFSVEHTKKTLPENWRSAKPIVHLANIFSEMEQKHYAQEFLSLFLSQEALETLQKDYPHLLENAIHQLQQAYTDGAQELSIKTQELAGKVHITEILPIQDQDEEERTKKELYGILQSCMRTHALHNIALLTRTNKEAKQLSEWLVEWNIPYTVEGGIFLQDSPLIQQILVFLSFIHTPNPTHFWVLLSSSLCKDYLPQETILQWRIDNKKTPLIEQFIQDFNTEWEECFALFCTNIELYTAYDYTQEIIQYFSLYERFPEHKAYMQALLEHLYICGTQKCISIPQFLSYWNEHKDTITIPSGTGKHIVQILSIHKSKGLEFPVVIIPFATGISTHQASLQRLCIHDILPESEHENAEDLLGIPLLSKTHAPQAVHYKKILEEAIETLNVMYVAYTRAKYELYCIIDTTKKESSRSPAKILQYIIHDTILQTKHHIQKITELPDKNIYEYSTVEEKEDTETIPQQYNSVYKIPFSPPLQKKYTMMNWLPCIKIIQNIPIIPEYNISSTERGILLHTAMELLDNTKNIDYSLRIALSKLTQEHYETCYADLHSRLTWFTHTQEANLFLQNGLCEQSIMIRGESFIRVDKILYTQEACIVIDYKTGTKNIENERQIRTYMQRVQELTHLPVRGVLIYFDEEEICTVVE